MQDLLIRNVDIISASGIEKSKNVFIRNGRIKSIEDFSCRSVDNENPNQNNSSSNTETYDFKGMYLLPGLIDIHTHGASGIDFFSKDLGKWVNYNYKNGVTSFLPTLLTMTVSDTIDCLDNLAGYIKKNDGYEGILGINMEGPYLNPVFGSQLASLCIEPRKEDYGKFIETAGKYLKIVTLAPELNGSGKLIDELIKNNTIVSIGHTDASGEQAENAIKSGAVLATHLFNAYGYPRGVSGRVPEGKICGVREIKALDVLLENDKIYTEVISDKNAVHVNPVLLRMLLKCKPMEKIILITDSMKGAGLNPGVYKLPDGRSYNLGKDDDVLFLNQYNMLCGSVLKLKNAVKNLIKHTGISLWDAVKTVTINPARLLGIDKEVGSIEKNKRANMVIMDRDFHILMTIAGGKAVYRA